jgi:hypothetical protein
MHIHKNSTLKLLRHVSILRSSSGSYTFLAKVTVKISHWLISLYKQGVVAACLIVHGYVVESARLWVCLLCFAAQHRIHTSTWSPLATYPYTIRHAATTPCLYNEINQWLHLMATLARKVQLPDVDLRIETCPSNFYVLMGNFYVCESVGKLIK